MTVTSSPAGEHAGKPGSRWERQLVSLGETVVEDDDAELAPPPRGNRETRRAARRTK